jgi:hypothetical protein
VSFVPSCENHSVPIYKANLSDTTLEFFRFGLSPASALEGRSKSAQGKRSAALGYGEKASCPGRALGNIGFDQMLFISTSALAGRTPLPLGPQGGASLCPGLISFALSARKKCGKMNRKRSSVVSH